MRYDSDVIVVIDFSFGSMQSLSHLITHNKIALLSLHWLKHSTTTLLQTHTQKGYNFQNLVCNDVLEEINPMATTPVGGIWP